MRIAVALMVSLFAVNLYAGKPTDPPTDPPTDSGGFVGYSTGELLEANPAYLLGQGAELCRETFGAGATIATSAHIRAAIDNGTYLPPLADYAASLPSDLLVFNDGSYWYMYDPNVNATYKGTGVKTVAIVSGPNSNVTGITDNLSTSQVYHAACIMQ